MRACRSIVWISLVAASLHGGAAQAARPLTFADLLAMRRVADPQVSPDGKSVAYVVTTADLAKNNTSSTIWLVPTASGEPRQLTSGPKHDRHPRFSPNGMRILFESNRSGSTQLWIIDLAGGEARQLTTIATEAHGGAWSPDGKAIAFVSAVYPEFSTKPFAESNSANQKRHEEIESSSVKAKVFDRLFYRHWDSWVENKRQHLFVVPAEGGEPRDLTPGDRDAFPTSTTFSTGDEFTFSPDGQWLVFAAPPQRDEAWSTNYDIYRVRTTGGAPQCLTEANAAADGCPRFSPDGKWLAYRAQKRPGFEADRWELMLMPADGGAARSLTSRIDRSIDSFVWSSDSQSLVCTAEQNAGTPLFKVNLSGEGWSELASGGTFASPTLGRDGRLVAARTTMVAPADCWLVETTGPPKNLTRANSDLLKELDLPAPQSVTVEGAGGAPMQMWIIKPPGFDTTKKWPLVYLVHGGPQGAWEDGWSYRWNPELWAAQGYVVALPNPRGSTGFGQEYVNAISGDWGGRCFEDLMAGLAHMEKLSYIDTSRMAAAGASFGGYMMNWFAGHTNKFKTLITHCGVYNFDSMYATTDELWFDEWEHGGPPWGKRESYEKHSPHRFAQNFKTPMLIIHNDLDFRVPVDEGFQLFTTLQRLGVESRLINFPDEGHWVTKPANSAYWHKEVFAWLVDHVPPGAK